MWLEELESKVAKLNELHQEHYDLISNFQSVSEDAIDEELNMQMENDQLYADDVNDKVMLMQAISPREKEKDALSSDLLQGQLKLKLPELKIPVFSNNSKDPFAFFRFKTSFANSLDNVNPTNLPAVDYSTVPPPSVVKSINEMTSSL